MEEYEHRWRSLTLCVCVCSGFIGRREECRCLMLLSRAGRTSVAPRPSITFSPSSEEESWFSGWERRHVQHFQALPASRVHCCTDCIRARWALCVRREPSERFYGQSMWTDSQRFIVLLSAGFSCAASHSSFTPRFIHSEIDHDPQGKLESMMFIWSVLLCVRPERTDSCMIFSFIELFYTVFIVTSHRLHSSFVLFFSHFDLCLFWIHHHDLKVIIIFMIVQREGIFDLFDLYLFLS